MSLPSKRIFDYYTIIPDTTEPRVLMCRLRNGWSLPHFVPVKNHFAHVYQINEEIKKQLDIDVTTLCCIYNDLDTDSDRVNRVFVLENHSPDWKTPAQYRWVDKYELSKLVLAVPEHRAVLKAWFDEAIDSTISVQRVPWARKGWFEKAQAWICDRLDNLGISAISPIEQLRAWATSCVMRVNTTSGHIYFKATPNVLGQEALFTQILAGYFPEIFPKILAVEPQEHWILMPDFGGTVLSEITDITHWEEALRLFAQIQIDSAPQVDSLISLGLPDRRIDKLPSEIELLLADTEALLAGDFIIIEETDVEKLRALIPQFKAMCEELTSYNLPQTLVHGDFWAKNVIVKEQGSGGAEMRGSGEAIEQGNLLTQNSKLKTQNYEAQSPYIYFDWPTSAIAHPFFDIVNFLYIEKYVPDIPDVRTRLRNVYLEQWTIYEPIERLTAAFELCQTLGMLYQAITYYRIVSNLEALAKWEIEVAVPLCLEKLLEHLREKGLLD